MRITLAGHKDDQVTLGHQVWCAILELGQMYGWRPQGTRVAPQRRGTLSAAPWDGTYLMAAGQLVADSDAQALAAPCAAPWMTRRITTRWSPSSARSTFRWGSCA